MQKLEEQAADSGSYGCPRPPANPTCLKFSAIISALDQLPQQTLHDWCQDKVHCDSAAARTQSTLTAAWPGKNADRCGAAADWQLSWPCGLVKVIPYSHN